MQRFIPILAVALVVAGLVLGFLAIGPPANTRRALLDEERLNNVRSIAVTIDQVYSDRFDHKLPRRSDVTVPRRNDGTSFWYDPETGVPFEYTASAGSRYVLCAVFSGANDAGDEPDPKWRHGAGRACFQLDARATNVNQTL